MKKLSCFFALLFVSINTAFAGIHIDTLKFIENDTIKNYSIKILYPKLANKPEFNLMITDFVNGLKQDAYNDVSVLETGSEYPYKMFADYTVYHADENLVSFVINVFVYPGDNDGSMHAHSFNYDLKQNKLIQFSDLFKPGALEFISDYCIKELISSDNIIDVDWVRSGAEPIEENYSAYTFTDSGLNIIFQQYQIEPYSVGPREVLVPKEKLRKYLQEDVKLF